MDHRHHHHYQVTTVFIINSSLSEGVQELLPTPVPLPRLPYWHDLIFIRQLDSWDFWAGRWGGRSLRWTSSETEAWDGPSGASFAGGCMLGSLPLAPLGGLSSRFRSCRPVRSGHRTRRLQGARFSSHMTADQRRGCEKLDFSQVRRLDDGGDEAEFTQIRRLDLRGRTEYLFVRRLD